MDLFHLSGPEFLRFYMVILATTVGIAALLRRWLRKPSDEPAEPPELSPCEVAYLADGKDQALAVALAGLMRSDAISVDGQERCCRSTGELPATVDPFEEALCSAIKPKPRMDRSWIIGTESGTASPEAGVAISELQSAASAPLAQIKLRLEELGLLVPNDQAFFARCLPTILVLAVVALGAIKIVIGASGHKPVGFLVFLSGFAGIIAMGGFAQPVHQSRRGDRLLARLQAENSSLETSLRSNPDSVLGADLALAVALFGLSFVTSGPLTDLKTALRPPDGSCRASGCGGACGGGCGGCGGGGGCGGCGG